MKIHQKIFLTILIKTVFSFSLYPQHDLSYPSFKAIVHYPARTDDSFKVILNDTLYKYVNARHPFRWYNLKPGPYHITILKEKKIIYSGTFFHYDSLTVHVFPPQHSLNRALEEITITGSMKEISRSESPVMLQVFQGTFFNKNPAPSLFESVQQISGIRPQVNCNVCNTGDIHINGMEGPYTMVLVDGMPLVSGLASVYGLTGIPRSMIQRLEVMKGPASSLYGSEAMGGILHVITRDPALHPQINMDYLLTSWKEHQLDLGTSFNISPHVNFLTGIHSFFYQHPYDKNQDGFTDIALQKRVSVFQKVNISGKKNSRFQFSFRYLGEDRWGGDIRWTPSFRGSDSIYGEAIDTRRWECFGSYRLPLQRDIFIWYFLNEHIQQSDYGTQKFDAIQKNYFIQSHQVWNLNNTDFLTGLSLRYNYYDDNTPATLNSDTLQPLNLPASDLIPAMFVQWEYKWKSRFRSLFGFRTDLHPVHGVILSPRMAIKYSPAKNTDVRINAGKGFRTVNIFTEEHAALTGARTVEIKNRLKPEESWNLSAGVVRKFYTSRQVIEWEGGIFYTRFSNRILPDYTTDVNKIIYDNLNGYAENKGIYMNAEWFGSKGLHLLCGANFLENSKTENGKTMLQMLSERFSATWNISYEWQKKKIRLDYTGNVYGPMLLPVQGTMDPRPEYSPWWALHNFQLTIFSVKNTEIYGGIKNIFDWTPWKGLPFLIPRTHDPFDKKVVYDVNGTPLPTSENPYGLVFDPSYVYAPNQGRRFFVGIRINISSSQKKEKE